TGTGPRTGLSSSWRSAQAALFPARRLPGKARRQRRLSFRLRLRFARRHVDLALELFFVRQSLQLVYEHQRVLRRDLELLAARLAGDLVVEAKQVVAQLGELGAVDFIGAGRQPILLGASHPANAVVVGPVALGTLIAAGSRFRFVVEKRALV